MSKPQENGSVRSLLKRLLNYPKVSDYEASHFAIDVELGSKLRPEYKDLEARVDALRAAHLSLLKFVSTVHLITARALISEANVQDN